MAKIELQPRDVEIGVIQSGDWSGTEIVRLKFPVATDPAFIKECRELGVIDARVNKKSE